MPGHGRNLKPLTLSLCLLGLILLGLIALVDAQDVRAARRAAGEPVGEQAPSSAPPSWSQADHTGTRAQIAATDEITSPSLDYVTLPGDFPHLAVQTSTAGVEAGYLFFGRIRPGYLLIVDDRGDPVYYRRERAGHIGFDFKPIGDGLLAYTDPIADEVAIMDSSYRIFRRVKPGNGLTQLDPHDFLFRDNGHMLIEANESRIIDMSAVVSGGHPAAIVTAQVVQDIDASGHVAWEWSSWDNYTITDSAGDLTLDRFDFVHINSLEIDHDGDLLVSSRRHDEVTKIDPLTGDVVWRLGGPNNDFTLVGGGAWHLAQHDARRLANGNLTVYDNRCSEVRPDPCTEYSRAVEYELDESAMEATIVWEYWNQGQGVATGSTQRLGNGNTLIGWGRSNFGATEVDSSATVVFDASFVGNPAEPEVLPDAISSYRVLRYPWAGCPAFPPTLVAQYEQGDDSISLHYSWNGATSVTGYEVYAGTSPTQTTVITTQPRTRFEDMTIIDDPEPGMHYFRVLPVTSDDCVAPYSNEVSVYYGYPVYLPVVLNNS